MAALRRYRGWIGGAAALAIVIGLILWLRPTGELTNQKRRVVQEITLVQPPPPPPEPEEKIMEEEPEIIEPTEAPQVQEDVDTPAEEPSDAPPAPSTEAAGLDRPADAGSDSFRLAAGKGGGLFGRGGGGGGGGWGAYVETHIRRALQRDTRTRIARGFVNVAVEIDPNGRFTAATLRSSTGDARLDAAIRDVLANLQPLGRGRPPKVDGLTYATINMKRTDG